MKPDKLPTINPRAPDLYRKIIDAAQQVRAERQTINALGWAAIKWRRVESMVRRED